MNNLTLSLISATIIDDPNGRAVLSRYIGSFPFMADMKIIGGLTLEQIAHKYPGYVSKEMIGKIEAALAKY